MGDRLRRRWRFPDAIAARSSAAQPREKARTLPHWIFALTLTAAALMAWSLHDSSSKAQESSAWVEHTHEVLDTISGVEDEITRAEAALRGYVVSGNASFVIEHESALKGIEDFRSRLALLVDAPEQRSRVRELNELIERRIQLMRQTVRLYDEAGAAAAAALVREAQQISQKIQYVVLAMEKEEQRLLATRRSQEEQRHALVTRLLLAAAALTALFLVPGYLSFVLQSRARMRAERKLFDMADSIPGVVYQYHSTPEGEWAYEFLGSGVEELFGVTRDTALEDPLLVRNMVVDEDRPALMAAIAHSAETLKPLQHDFRVRTPAGEVKWVRTSAAPRRVAGGDILWNGHWADVTAQVQMRHALRDAKLAADEASRAKSAFLAVMSHEIRTPLNGMLGMLELLTLTHLDADQRHVVTVVRESGRSLQRIIDDILDFSKIEAGKLDIEAEPVSIAQIVDSTRSVYAGNASSKGLLLTCKVDSRISPALMADPLRLRQILNNFVSNAIKFSSEGAIEIHAELVARDDDGETVRLSVIDQGVGMPADVQARLFEPFYQGMSRTHNGTGLGLTICRRLATMMGGTVEAKSAAGVGTTMSLTVKLPLADPRDLPVQDAPPQRAADAPVLPARGAPPIEQAERERTLVLVADDHSTNRMVLRRQINSLGYAGETASDGREALEKWQSGRYALVITDINMPRMSGYELARELRRREAEQNLPRTPIIACTANALKGEAEACLEAGMDDYLAKPVYLAELQTKLTQWLPLPGDGAAPGQEKPAGVDSSALAELTHGEPGAELEILAEFRRASEEDFATLRSAVESGDMPAAARAAHRMKGASRMVGMTGMAAAAGEIERAASASDAGTIAIHMQALSAELTKVSRYVDAFRAEAGV